MLPASQKPSLNTLLYGYILEVEILSNEQDECSEILHLTGASGYLSWVSWSWIFGRGFEG